MRIIFSIFLFLRITFFLFAQNVPTPARRAFTDIFPGLSSTVTAASFSNAGYVRTYGRVQQSALVGSGAIAPHIINTVMNENPRFLVESIMVVPHITGEYSLLNVYNALGRIRGLRGRLYHSHTRNQEVPLFEEATRIQSARSNTPVNDPPSATSIPSSETIYIRLKDNNFGNSFYRGDMALESRGLRYTLTNNKSLMYLLVPVIGEGKFITQLYVEPISEGILIYALAGADVSDFVSSRIDMPSAIGKRLAVIIGWLAEGITR